MRFLSSGSITMPEIVQMVLTNNGMIVGRMIPQTIARCGTMPIVKAISSTGLIVMMAPRFGS